MVQSSRPIAVSTVEAFTRFTSVNLSRRKLMKRAVTIGALIGGAKLFEVIPVAADYNCVQCDGPCTTCQSSYDMCCSSGTNNCVYYQRCQCQSGGCNCGTFRVRVLACDSSFQTSCPNC